MRGHPSVQLHPEAALFDTTHGILSVWVPESQSVDMFRLTRTARFRITKWGGSQGLSLLFMSGIRTTLEVRYQPEDYPDLEEQVLQWWYRGHRPNKTETAPNREGLSTPAMTGCQEARLSIVT